MFGETTISQVKVWNHLIETTTLKGMFRVPGNNLSFLHGSLMSFQGAQKNSFKPCGNIQTTQSQIMSAPRGATKKKNRSDTFHRRYWIVHLGSL